MKLNNKGQMIVLDVLFAVALMILEFLLIFKISEVEIYNSNSQRQIEKLNRVGNLSYATLMNQGSIGCYVKDAPQNFFIPGTIKTNSPMTRAVLAIPTGYNCNLSIPGVAMATPECTSPVPSTGDIYSIDFTIGSCTAHTDKSTYLTCTKSGCSWLTERTGTLKIWRLIKYEERFYFFNDCNIFCGSYISVL
jgi:hypothetical protein